MFAQPFFPSSMPMGSRSYYREPYFSPAPQASYYDDFPFGLGSRQSVYAQPRYVRPAFADYDDSSSDDEETEVCTCGRCALPATSFRTRVPPTTSRPIQQRGGNVKSSPLRPGLAKPATKTPKLKESFGNDLPLSRPATSPVAKDTSEPEAKRESPVMDVPLVEAAEKVKEFQSTVETSEESNVEDEEVHVDSEKMRAQVLASFSNVTSIVQDIDSLRGEVEQFCGAKGSKDYLRLEDTLTRVLLRLDMIESHGDAKVRSVRRNAVVSAQEALDLLESKVKPSMPEAEVAAAEAPGSIQSMEYDDGESLPSDHELQDVSEDEAGNSDMEPNSLDTSLLFGM